MPRPRPWSDDDLRRAVAKSATLADVCRELGIHLGGKSYDSIRRRIDELRIDASHIARLKRGPRTTRAWTDDDLRDAVAASRTHSDVQRRLGYTPNGGIHRYVAAHIKRLGLDTSHFNGRGWNRGQRKPADRVRRDLRAVLVKGSMVRTGHLRERLIRAGLKERRCERCGRDSWLGELLPLELDHVNGDHTDNRIENLRILCPNCHALTETWCGRNKKPA